MKVQLLINSDDLITPIFRPLRNKTATVQELKVRLLKSVPEGSR